MASAPPRLTPNLVADDAAMAELTQAISSEHVIALDTESNSFHVYRERVCLMQLSTRSCDFVIDPFAVDVRPLGPLLAAATTVLHGADYDVRCLKREYGFSLPGLFDTMVASRRLGSTALGLSALVERYFGVKLSKEFQRSNWGNRPLRAEQVRYAALDTHFLLALYDIIEAELRAHDVWDAAKEEFSRIASVEPRPKIFDVEGWRRIKGANQLDRAGKQVLRALWIAREQRAEGIDRPPFKIMPEQTMLEVARRRPHSEEELLSISGVTPVVLRRMGSATMDALRKGAESDSSAGGQALSKTPR